MCKSHGIFRSYKDRSRKAVSLESLLKEENRKRAREEDETFVFVEVRKFLLHIRQSGKADFAVFAHFGQGSIGSLCCAAGGKDIIYNQDMLAG